MKQQQTKQPTAAQRYLELLEKNVELIDITAPSGFVFKFRKPNFLGMAIGTLYSLSPAQIGKVLAGESIEQTDGPAALRTMLETRDRVLKYSHTPKIVVGEPQNENELSTEDIANTDLLYIFKWFSTGGNSEVMKSMFAKAGE